MKIYTKSGDKGKTSLFSGERVSKAASRVEAYGDVDELNSVLGALAASLSGDNPQIGRAVEQVQRDLFCVGGRLATTPDSPAFEDLPDLDDGRGQEARDRDRRNGEDASPVERVHSPGRPPLGVLGPRGKDRVSPGREAPGRHAGDDGVRPGGSWAGPNGDIPQPAVRLPVRVGPVLQSYQRR